MESFVERIAQGLIWVFAVVAMAVGMAFMVSKTVPRRPNKASRLFVSFVLG
jgi:hypothetical protein